MAYDSALLCLLDTPLCYAVDKLDGGSLDKNDTTTLCFREESSADSGCNEICRMWFVLIGTGPHLGICSMDIPVILSQVLRGGAMREPSTNQRRPNHDGTQSTDSKLRAVQCQTKKAMKSSPPVTYNFVLLQ